MFGCILQTKHDYYEAGIDYSFINYNSGIINNIVVNLAFSQTFNISTTAREQQKCNTILKSKIETNIFS